MPRPIDRAEDKRVRTDKANCFASEIMRAGLAAFKADGDAIPLDMIMGMVYALSQVLACYEAEHAGSTTMRAAILEGIDHTVTQLMTEVGDDTPAAAEVRVMMQAVPRAVVQCASCGSVNRTTTIDAQRRAPQDGDYSLCAGCGQWHRRDAGAWVRITIEDVTDPAVRAELEDVAANLAAFMRLKTPRRAGHVLH